MRLLDAVRVSAEGFEATVAGLRVKDLAVPTSCGDWSVRDVIEHVVVGSRAAVAMLAGSDLTGAFEPAARQGLSSPPFDDVRTTGDQLLGAFRAADRDQPVAHVVGNITWAQFAGIRIGEYILHGWDVQHALGHSAVPDDELAEIVLASYEPIMDAARQYRAFAGPTTPGPEATSGQRLLHRSGRI